jgi:hypothetical protein
MGDAVRPETPCAACGGAAHDATGHRWSAKVLVCGPCARRFFKWAQGHTRPRKGLSFYDAAVRWSKA